MRRGQASITVAEAAIGILLLASLTFAFALGGPSEKRGAETQLDLYASDAVTILITEGPRHADRTRLGELTASRAAFERERDELERRVDRILPANLLFQIETSHGMVGSSLPDDVPAGQASVTTTNDEVTLRVWYA